MLKIFFIFTTLVLVIACPDGCSLGQGGVCLCDSSNVTSVSCSHGTTASTRICMFDCSDNSCNGKTIECSSTFDTKTLCVLDCSNPDSCKDTTFLCSTSECSVNCEDGSCENIISVCTADTNCRFYCTGNSSCVDSKFDCTSDTCLAGCFERDTPCIYDYQCTSNECDCRYDPYGKDLDASECRFTAPPPTPTPRPNYTQRSNTKYTLGTDEEDDNEKDNGAWRANLALLSLSLC